MGNLGRAPGPVYLTGSLQAQRSGREPGDSGCGDGVLRPRGFVLSPCLLVPNPCCCSVCGWAALQPVDLHPAHGGAGGGAARGVWGRGRVPQALAMGAGAQGDPARLSGPPALSEPHPNGGGRWGHAGGTFFVAGCRGEGVMGTGRGGQGLRLSRPQHLPEPGFHHHIALHLVDQALPGQDSGRQVQGLVGSSHLVGGQPHIPQVDFGQLA